MFVSFIAAARLFDNRIMYNAWFLRLPWHFSQFYQQKFAQQLDQLGMCLWESQENSRFIRDFCINRTKISSQICRWTQYLNLCRKQNKAKQQQWRRKKCLSKNSPRIQINRLFSSIFSIAKRQIFEFSVEMSKRFAFRILV